MAITPDDKDWTWVLDRFCPECGFDPRTVVASEVADMVRDLVPRWREVLEGAQVGVRPSPDRWSPLEYGCHVRDVFLLYDDRLSLMLAVDDAEFANWDQDSTAVERRYDLEEAREVSMALGAAAEMLAARFDGVQGAQWQRTGFRSDGKSFTVATFAVYMVHDPIHHLWDVSDR